MKIDVSTKQNQVHPQSLDLGLSIRHEFIELKKPRSVNDTQLYKFKSGAVFFFWYFLSFEAKLSLDRV